MLQIFKKLSPENVIYKLVLLSKLAIILIIEFYHNKISPFEIFALRKDFINWWNKVIFLVIHIYTI